MSLFSLDLQLKHTGARTSLTLCECVLPLQSFTQTNLSYPKCLIAALQVEDGVVELGLS